MDAAGIQARSARNRTCFALTDKSNNMRMMEFLENGYFPLRVNLSLLVFDFDILESDVLIVVGCLFVFGLSFSHPDDSERTVAQDFDALVLVLSLVGPGVVVVQGGSENVHGHHVREKRRLLLLLVVMAWRQIWKTLKIKFVKLDIWVLLPTEEQNLP